MNLNVSGHHVTITPAIRGHVQSKIARISRHFDHLIDVNVILSSQKLRRKAEATVSGASSTLRTASDKPSTTLVGVADGTSKHNRGAT